ncbi:MAG: undecaprenyl-diphosphate phosphatase [Lachnospiraceae bacterium]|nr:undecaprenyl-diphosphate phosphatase [Lachnospiraceae bacterium]
MLDILIAILFGLVEGITEWLPVSSTGHMILLEEFIKFEGVSEGFFDMFEVVIQLGAIMAVVILYWNKIFPFKITKKHAIKVEIDKDIFSLWFKILAACVPAAIVGLLFDDILEEYLYNGYVVSAMLIIFGIAFIVVENWNKGKKSRVNSLAELTYQAALIIGVFQLIAAVFPGTSRSGATIVGALLIGVSRTVAAEFTFYLAIPVMFGASLLKILKFGLAFTGLELAVLLIGMLVAFVVSMVVIKFLMAYIKRHDFKVFGWYRIVLGAIVLAYFVVFR